MNTIWRLSTMKNSISWTISHSLLASSAASAFAAEHHPVQHPKQIKSVEFQPMKAPTTIENMIKTYTEASVKVTYKDGSVEETPLNYNQLFLSKDKIVDNKGELIAAGTPIDANGDQLLTEAFLISHHRMYQTRRIQTALLPLTVSLILFHIMNTNLLIMLEKRFPVFLLP